uniref:Uncharacterized protein n=1 Tax=Oryza meridionalis TaxID=40149 RepID=A0A0E0EFR8_9ORYZ
MRQLSTLAATFRSLEESEIRRWWRARLVLRFLVVVGSCSRSPSPTRSRDPLPLAGGEGKWNGRERVGKKGDRRGEE